MELEGEEWVCDGNEAGTYKLTFMPLALICLIRRSGFSEY